VTISVPPCRVSTHWLSSSKWIAARGGRCSRCVHFCAMHLQCLPKTVRSVTVTLSDSDYVNRSTSLQLLRLEITRLRADDREYDYLHSYHWVHAHPAVTVRNRWRLLRPGWSLVSATGSFYFCERYWPTGVWCLCNVWWCILCLINFLELNWCCAICISRGLFWQRFCYLTLSSLIFHKLFSCDHWVFEFE